jgi:hypothetical protein
METSKIPVTPTAKEKPDYRKFISSMASTPLQNYAFTNQGNLNFKNNAKSVGLSQSTFSNGAAYGDLDNDGDLDLVVNNINTASFVYRNETNQTSNNHFLKVRFKGPEKNRFGIGAEVRLKGKDGIKVLQNYNTRGFQSSIEPCLLFGIGKAAAVDTLYVTWPGGNVQTITNVKANQTITLESGAASPAGTILRCTNYACI